MQNIESVKKFIDLHNCDIYRCDIVGDKIIVKQFVLHAVSRRWFDETITIENMRQARNLLGY